MPHTFVYLDEKIVAPCITEVIAYLNLLREEYGDLPVIFVDEWEGLRGLDFDDDISHSYEDGIGEIYYLPERLEVG